MDEEYIFANFNDSDEDEIQQQIKYRFKNRIIYNQPNDFHERFRFTHRQAELLLQALENKLDSVILACACLQNWLIDNRFEDKNDDKEFDENNIEISSYKNDGYNEELEDNRVEQQIKTFIEFSI
uniref:Uncharacterized protein n=1 Tax=Meloidogyne floridensis TaxID=298350 RepID=A0A915NJQ5_9BILA